MIKKINRISFRETQKQKSKILKAKPKKAQEEVVGFAMIIVLVAVIILIFLVLSIKPEQKESVESYEAESFLQAILQQTSNCRSQDSLKELYHIKNLLFKCYKNETCEGGKNSCELLTTQLKGLSDTSWNPSVDSPIKGYVLNITVDGNPWKMISSGNLTKNTKGSFQEFLREGKNFRLDFRAYY